MSLAAAYYSAASSSRSSSDASASARSPSNRWRRVSSAVIRLASGQSQRAIRLSSLASAGLIRSPARASRVGGTVRPSVQHNPALGLQIRRCCADRLNSPPKNRHRGCSDLCPLRLEAACRQATHIRPQGCVGRCAKAVIQLNDVSREQASCFRKLRSPEQQVRCVCRARWA